MLTGRIEIKGRHLANYSGQPETPIQGDPFWLTADG